MAYVDPNEDRTILAGRPYLPKWLETPALDARIGAGVEPNLPARLEEAALSATYAAAPASAATAANTQRLMSKLRRNVEDASYLYIGDSTGNEVNEHVYLEAVDLGARFPAYTVLYYLADPTTGVYAAPVTVQTGSGAQTLHIYNASISGQQPAWFIGSRWAAVVTAAGEVDVVFISHGHNMNYGDPLLESQRQQIRNNFFALTEELTWKLPRTGIVLMSQNPTFLTGRATWQAIKAGEMEVLAARRGFGFIDVHEAFQATGNPEAYVKADQIHPTTDVDAPAPNGSRLWADTVLKALDYAPFGAAGSSRDTLFLTQARQLAPNREFETWTAADPDGWTSLRATTTKDTTLFETGTYSAKITTTTDSGQAELMGTWLTSAMGGTGFLDGQTVTVSARIFVPDTNTSLVSLIVRDQAGSGSQSRTDLPSTARGRWFWWSTTKKLVSPTTRIYIYLVPRISGTAVVEMNVDRISVTLGDMPKTG